MKMSPTTSVRNETRRRDWHRCVCCGAVGELDWNPREIVRRGVPRKKTPPFTAADGVMTCPQCTALFKTELHGLALAMGWKFKHHRGGLLAIDVPMFDRVLHRWHRVDDHGGRERLTDALAHEMLRAVGVAGGV